MNNILNEINDQTAGFVLKPIHVVWHQSDNYPFYQQFGIPAHAISTFDFTNFDYYHHVDDEVDKLDYTHMTNFINSMIPAIEGMNISESKEIKMNNDK